MLGNPAYDFRNFNWDTDVDYAREKEGATYDAIRHARLPGWDDALPACPSLDRRLPLAQEGILWGFLVLQRATGPAQALARQRPVRERHF